MTNRTQIVVLAMVVAACGGTGSTGTTTGVETTTSTVPTTTTTVPTTTTEAAADLTQGTCGALKVALFDLEEELASLVTGHEDIDELSDEESAVLLLAPVVGFYQHLSELAGSAPEEVSADMSEVAGTVTPLADMLASGDLEGLDLDGAELPFELDTDASGRLDAWAAESCAISSSFAPEELIASSLFNAVFGAFGEGLGELEEGFGDPGGGTSPEAYGDDSALDALWDACGSGNGASCDELYWQTFGVYELFAETCGGRAGYRASSGGNCEERLNEAGPMAHGDDAYFDGLWDSCETGDGYSCDSLAGSSPLGSEYAEFGAGCGGTVTDGRTRACSAPEEPFAYGDDPELDTLWDSCAGGDAEVCTELYFEAPLSSAYETMGDTCGILLGRGEGCELVVELLAGPRG